MGTNSSISLLFCTCILFSAVVADLASCAGLEFAPASVPSPKPESKPTSLTEYASTPVASNRGCSQNLLKLAMCSPLLHLPINLGGPVSQPCCATLQGLLDVELSVCLCLAVKANILGTNVSLPIALNLLMDTCKIQNPLNFHCA